METRTQRREVKTFLTRLICPSCDGEMKPTGMTLTTYPVKYPHICEGCGLASVEKVTYPVLTYEEVALETGDKDVDTT